MRVAVKPVITTGVALVGASVIAVAPIEPPAHTTARVVEQDVSLTASSLAYVPINMIEQVFSAPANMVAALDRLATALVISGSWNESHPNNVWGWDPANPAMFREMINTLIPFPAFSNPWGTHLDWWVTANFPMYAGCAYECDDLAGMLAVMFKVPMSEFYSEEGYTFPTVINPIDGVETEWSGQTIKLDPAEPIRSVWNSLVAEPTGIKTVTWYEMVSAVANFGAALQITGHLPGWIAVREIEQFVKLFLRAPEEEVEQSVTDDESGTPPESSADAADESDLVSVSTFTSLRVLDSGAAESVAEQTSVGESLSGESSEAIAVESPVEPSPVTVVEKATDELKKKFESAPVDEVSEEDAEATDDEAVDEPSGTDDAADDDAADDDAADDDAADDDKDRSEADTSTSSGGKHRKADDSTDSGSSQGKSGGSKDSGDKSGGSKDSGDKDSGSKGSDD